MICHALDLITSKVFQGFIKYLVGGFNPSEKYELVKLQIFPIFGAKIKTYLKPPIIEVYIHIWKVTSCSHPFPSPWNHLIDANCRILIFLIAALRPGVVHVVKGPAPNNHRVFNERPTNLTFNKNQVYISLAVNKTTHILEEFPQKKHLGHGCLISNRNQTERFQTSRSSPQKVTTSIFTLPFRIDSLNFLLKILSLKLTAKAPENRQCMHFQSFCC